MMGKISVNELAAKLIERKGLSKKQAAAFVNEMFDIIQRGLETDKAVKVKGFGTFKIINVDDRESINVNTGERVLIEGHSKITFSPDAVMKELVNKPFSQFETVVLKDGVDFDDVPASEDIDADSAPLVDFVAETEEVLKEPVVLQEESMIIEKQESLVEEQKLLIEEEKPLVETSVEEHIKEEIVEPVIQAIVKEDIESEDSSDEEIIYEEETSGAWKKWAIPIVFCIVGFAAGYLVANMMHTPIDAEQPKQEDITEAKPQFTDSVAQVPGPQPDVKDESQTEVKPEAVPDTEPEVKLETKPEVKPESALIAMDKYEKMDSRILHGAYRIVGTDHVEKIKDTDNLAKICKRTIGPGMECYLEAYNGIKGDADLKPGQDIKIPQLELKKKRNKK